MSETPSSLARDFFSRGGSHAFGIPGGGPSLEWVDSFQKSGGTFITTGLEATGGFAAGAFGRLGRAAAAVSIKGPGFANLIPALLSNRYEGNPMLVFSEAYASGDYSGRRHKWLDQRAATPWLRHTLHPGSNPPVARAMAAARVESPSPVLVELPSGDKPSAPYDSPGTFLPTTPNFSQLRQASRVMLIVGSCALRQPWGKKLRELDLPVFTTAAAKGALDESLPHAAGIYTGDGKPATMETALLPLADLVILLGVRAGEILSPRPPGASCLAFEAPGSDGLDVFPDDPTDTRTLDAAGEEELFSLLSDRSWGVDEVAAAKKEQRTRLDSVDPQWGEAFDTLVHLAPEATHVLDTGNFTVLAEHFLSAPKPHSVLGTPNGRFMGAGIGHALGAAFARPGHPVFLWIGDGGIRSYFAELALAAEHALPLLVICLRDGYFGSILGRALNAGFETSPLLMRERHLDAVAGQWGLASVRLQGLDQLGSFAQQWIRSPAPAFAEVHLDSNLYLQTASLFR
jgi:acetolactate synthase-1/2/3 large subunit